MKSWQEILQIKKEAYIKLNLSKVAKEQLSNLFEVAIHSQTPYLAAFIVNQLYFDAKKTTKWWLVEEKERNFNAKFAVVDAVISTMIFVGIDLENMETIDKMKEMRNAK